MGARQSKRSVDITTTPKKGDGEIVAEGEGKLEKIGDADVKATTNGAVVHTDSETGDADEVAKSETEKDTKEAIKENGLPESSDEANTPETIEANGEQISETQEKAASSPVEIEAAKAAEETPEGKKSKEKSKKKKWSFRSISFSKKDKSKPNKEGDKNGEVKEVAEENAEEIATSPSIESPKDEDVKPQDVPINGEDAAKSAEEPKPAASEEVKTVEEAKPAEEIKAAEAVIEKAVETVPSPVKEAKEETPAAAEPIQETKEVRSEEVPPPLPSSNPPSPVTVFAESTKADALTADQVPICSAPVIETIPEQPTVQSVVESIPQAASSPMTQSVTESAPQVIESKVQTISSPILEEKLLNVESEILPKEILKTETSSKSETVPTPEQITELEKVETNTPEEPKAAIPIEIEVASKAVDKVPVEQSKVLEQTNVVEPNPNITEPTELPQPTSVIEEHSETPDAVVEAASKSVAVELSKVEEVVSEEATKYSEATFAEVIDIPVKLQPDEEQTPTSPELSEEIMKEASTVPDKVTEPQSTEVPTTEVPTEIELSDDISKTTPETSVEPAQIEKAETTVGNIEMIVDTPSTVLTDIPDVNPEVVQTAPHPTEAPVPLPADSQTVEKAVEPSAESPKTVPELPKSPSPCPPLGTVSESLSEPAVSSPEPISHSEPTKPIDNAESLPDISTESLPSLPEPLSENLAEPMSLPPVDSVPEPIASDCPESDLPHLPTNDSPVLTNGNANGLPTPTDEVVSPVQLIEGVTKQVPTEVFSEARQDGDTPAEAVTTNTAASEE